MNQIQKFKMETNFCGVGVKTKLVSVVGNIGAGKSTVITNPGLKNVGVIEEYLTGYRNFEKHDPLELMYQNPGENVHLVQHHFIKCINKQLRNTDSASQLWITDRSLFCPKVFIQNHFRGKRLSEFSRDYLINETDEYALKTLQEMSLEYVGIFYLDTPPEICLERIKERNRKCESLIEIPYLQGLKEYEESMKWWETQLGIENVCRVSGLNTKEDIFHQFQDFVKKFL